MSKPPSFVEINIPPPADQISGIAHSVTNSIMQTIGKEMDKQGVLGGMGERGLTVRNAVYEMVSVNIMKMVGDKVLALK